LVESPVQRELTSPAVPLSVLRTAGPKLEARRSAGGLGPAPRVACDGRLLAVTICRESRNIMAPRDWRQDPAAACRAIPSDNSRLQIRCPPRLVSSLHNSGTTRTSGSSARRLRGSASRVLLPANVRSAPASRERSDRPLPAPSLVVYPRFRVTNRLWSLR
jgi:hypothetical protein